MESAYHEKNHKLRASWNGVRFVGLMYVFILIVIPIIVIVQDGFRSGFAGLWHQVNLPIAKHAILLTLWTSVVMTLINTFFGMATAYVFVRCHFPGKKICNAVVDLPLAIPSLVTGVMLVTLYGPQHIIGKFFEKGIGFRVIFAPPGIVLALLFITYPFVVRTIQPVLEEMDLTQEKAATTLGASPWMIFRKVIFPTLALPTFSGALLTFSRAVGEFGAVVIVAGNIPLYSQTASVYVLGAVESENRLGASAISIVLMIISLSMLLLSNAVRHHWDPSK